MALVPYIAAVEGIADVAGIAHHVLALSHKVLAPPANIDDARVETRLVHVHATRVVRLLDKRVWEIACGELGMANHEILAQAGGTARKDGRDQHRLGCKCANDEKNGIVLLRNHIGDACDQHRYRISKGVCHGDVY